MCRILNLRLSSRGQGDRAGPEGLEALLRQDEGDGRQAPEYWRTAAPDSPALRALRGHDACRSCRSGVVFRSRTGRRLPSSANLRVRKFRWGAIREAMVR